MNIYKFYENQSWETYRLIFFMFRSGFEYDFTKFDFETSALEFNLRKLLFYH